MQKYTFELNDVFEKTIKNKINILPDEFVFVFILNKDVVKSYKRIAAAIEDSFKIISVKRKNTKLAIHVKRRRKANLIFPKDDVHFNKEKDRYQLHTLIAAMSYVKNNKLALDIGGHIGLYSSALLDSFEKVYSFEPSPDNIICFKKNAKGALLNEVALGDAEGEVVLNLALDNSGNNSIVEKFSERQVKVPVKTLDVFNITNIDLIKIDVQGYEPHVLRGAEKTLLNNDPIIIIELITHKNDPPNQEAIDILTRYKYRILDVIGKDYIMGK